MKRLYIVLTIFLSSFFFLSSSEVKADTYDYSIPENVINFNVENITTIINIVETFLENDNTYYDYYFISYIPSQNTVYVYFSTVSDVSFVEFYYYSGARIRVQSKFVRYTVNLNTSSLHSYTSATNINNFIKNIFNTDYILYSNFDIVLPDNGNIYNYTFFEKTYQDISNGEHLFTTVNDMCNDYYNNSDPVKTNPVDYFYTIIISKIILLGNDFANNPILLTLVVICILIFLFELIFRRHL